MNLGEGRIRDRERGEARQWIILKKESRKEVKNGMWDRRSGEKCASLALLIARKDP